MRSERSIRIGDVVAYRAEFLRSIGCYSGDLPFARGKVKHLKRFSSGFLVTVAWDTAGVPERVNIANLCRVDSPEFASL